MEFSSSMVDSQLYMNILVLLEKSNPASSRFIFNKILEDTARYAGLLLASAEGFGRGRGKKESLLCCFGPFLAIFGAQ